MDYYTSLLESYSLLKKRKLKLLIEQGNQNKNNTIDPNRLAAASQKVRDALSTVPQNYTGQINIGNGKFGVSNGPNYRLINSGQNWAGWDGEKLIAHISGRNAKSNGITPLKSVITAIIGKEPDEEPSKKSEKEQDATPASTPVAKTITPKEKLAQEEAKKQAAEERKNLIDTQDGFLITERFLKEGKVTIEVEDSIKNIRESFDTIKKLFSTRTGIDQGVLDNYFLRGKNASGLGTASLFTRLTQKVTVIEEDESGVRVIGKKDNLTIDELQEAVKIFEKLFDAASSEKPLSDDDKALIKGKISYVGNNTYECNSTSQIIRQKKNEFINQFRTSKNEEINDLWGKVRANVEVEIDGKKIKANEAYQEFKVQLAKDVAVTCGSVISLNIGGRRIVIDDPVMEGTGIIENLLYYVEDTHEVSFDTIDLVKDINERLNSEYSGKLHEMYHSLSVMIYNKNLAKNDKNGKNDKLIKFWENKIKEIITSSQFKDYQRRINVKNSLFLQNFNQATLDYPDYVDLQTMRLFLRDKRIIPAIERLNASRVSKYEPLASVMVGKITGSGRRADVVEIFHPEKDPKKLPLGAVKISKKKLKEIYVDFEQYQEILDSISKNDEDEVWISSPGLKTSLSNISDTGIETIYQTTTGGSITSNSLFDLLSGSKKEEKDVPLSNFIDSLIEENKIDLPDGFKSETEIVSKILEKTNSLASVVKTELGSTTNTSDELSQIFTELEKKLDKKSKFFTDFTNAKKALTNKDSTGRREATRIISKLIRAHYISSKIDSGLVSDGSEYDPNNASPESKYMFIASLCGAGGVIDEGNSTLIKGVYKDKIKEISFIQNDLLKVFIKGITDPNSGIKIRKGNRKNGDISYGFTDTELGKKMGDLVYNANTGKWEFEYSKDYLIKLSEGNRFKIRVDVDESKIKFEQGQDTPRESIVVKNNNILTALIESQKALLNSLLELEKKGIANL